MNVMTLKPYRSHVCIDQSCTKLVVFAGENIDSFFADIYVLDMATMEWTMGPSSGDGRLGMTCTMYDDGFLAWGGKKETRLRPNGPSAFYLD
jgi:hypothetical protein